MSGFTIHEMENVARSMGPQDVMSLDLGNIDLTQDMGKDGLGLSMLANVGGNSKSESKHVTIDPVLGPSNSGGAFSEIELNTLEPMEPITLNLGSNLSQPPVEIQFTKSSNEFSSSNTGTSGGSLFSNNQSSTSVFNTLSPAPAPRLSPEEEQKEKSDLVNKLQRLESKGFSVSRRYTMDNTLEEMKQEYNRLLDARNLETSIKFQRQMMVGAVTGLQWMNDRFDPFDLKLDGWSESVHESIEDFDEIFEELYDKYKEKGKMPPEARLIMSLAGSGFMCHVSNTFLRSKMPSMDDILKQNPDMARQFAQAAAKSAGPGFGNFMNMAMGGSEPAPAQQQQNAGAFFGSSAQQTAPPMAQVPQSVAAMEPRQTARREMKGPSGVDDILKTFEDARRAEAEAPSQSNPTPRLDEARSIATDDIGSTAGSQAGGRRARRSRAPVIGNSMSLEV
jgi:hypothetical protein